MQQDMTETMIFDTEEDKQVIQEACNIAHRYVELAEEDEKKQKEKKLEKEKEKKMKKNLTPLSEFMEVENE